MTKFDIYSEYINIVQKTNNIFDIWFFEKGIKDKSALSAKKRINKLSFSNQTSQIIDFLLANNAPHSIVKAFSIRKEIEENIFDPKEDITNAMLKIKELEKEFVEAA